METIINGHSDQIDYTKGFLAGISMGTVGVSTLLLKGYAKLGLNENELMLIIHIIAFREKENNDFPTPDELKERMSLPHTQVMEILRKLVRGGWIAIEEQVDPISGIQSEQYQLAPLYQKLAAYIQANPEATNVYDATDYAELANDEGKQSQAEVAVTAPGKVKEEKDIYQIFELEFARPLSLMEAEMIISWEEKDRYPRELILFALKEAVFAAKLNFRYIDRILLEWQRNRIQTVDQAKEHTKNFRAR